MTEEQEKLKETYKEQFEEVVSDLKTPGKRKKQIPNILTASRLLSPLIIIPAAIVGNAGFAAAAAVAFGLTDFFDGKLARKWDCKSQFGADLDAVTDKVFAGTLLLAGAVFNPILFANIGLETLIAGINVKEKLDGKKPASTKVGKVKTGFIFGLGALGLLAPAISMPAAILPGLALTTAAFQGATILSYLDKYQQPTSTNQQPYISNSSSPELQTSFEEAEEKEKVKTYEKGVGPTCVVTPQNRQYEKLVDEIIAAEEKQGSEIIESPKEYVRK